MKHRELWGYNRHEVVRGILKGTIVPGLTFGNIVLYLSTEVQAGLEINQRAIGKLALGAHGKATNEAVQGDMGWTSFEAREAGGQLRYLNTFTERAWTHIGEKWLKK